jgi:hypothetical protein
VNRLQYVYSVSVQFNHLIVGSSNSPAIVHVVKVRQTVTPRCPCLLRLFTIDFYVDNL